MTLNVICKDVILLPSDISILKNSTSDFICELRLTIFISDIKQMPDIFQKSIAYILAKKAIL